MLVSKYLFRVFRNPKTQKVVADAFKEVETQYKLQIKEMSFGDDFAHVHMEISVWNTFIVQRAKVDQKKTPSMRISI